MASALGEKVRCQLEENLSSVCYKRCLKVLYEMHCRLLSPNMFREKMKFLFRHPHHSHLLTQLNPLLPDEYQFSSEELQQEARDYQELQKFKEGIKFVNDLTKAVESTEELGKFYELVKSRKRKEIDDEKFYGSAYECLDGDFDMMKKLGNILGDPMTVSYVKQPESYTREAEATSVTSGQELLALNNTCRIYGTGARARKSTGTRLLDDNYIYRVGDVIKESWERPSHKGRTAKERKDNFMLWFEDRKNDLDVLKEQLKTAEEEVELALERIKSGMGMQKAVLKDYVVKHVKKVYGPVEKLVEPLEDRLPAVVNELRLKREEVELAIHDIDEMRDENLLPELLS